MKTSAELLEGRTLANGWKVVAPAPTGVNSTGGNFSKSYIVEAPDGRRAFLKALDYSRAFKSPDPARTLQALTEAFNFERDTLLRCRENRLDRIVVALDDGIEKIEGAPDGGVVQYLIFELAAGDVRSQADTSKRFELAFALRALHHISVGLRQLHSHGIAHQDLKPSNVLVFPQDGSKLADLGRAAYKGHAVSHDDLHCAGDPTYAPPELLYHQVDPDWNRRRQGCDAYLMGSMVVFFFAGVGMTAVIAEHLDPVHRWANWPGTYSEVLPYVQHAFSRALDDLSPAFPAAISDSLFAAVAQLCDPDPRLRGDPSSRVITSNQYSMERYISRFNLLARHAELGLVTRYRL